jgi:hypothetical protein
VKLLGLGLALLSLAGCATASAPKCGDWRDRPTQYGHERNMVAGLGSAPASAADAHQTARQRALADLASQIQVQVRAQLISNEQFTRRGTKTLDTEHVESKIDVTTTMNLVGAQSLESCEEKGTFYLLLGLDRAKARSTLLAELRPTLGRFHAAQARAEEALQRLDRPGFTAAWLEARQAGAASLPLAAQIGALGPMPAEVQRIGTDLGAIAAAGSQLRAQTSFQVALEAPGVPADLASSTAELVRQVLARLSREATLGDAACSPSSATYRVEVRLDPRCHWGSLGHSCAPQVQVIATECAGGRRIFEAGLGDPKQIAATDSRDADRALRKALGLLTAERVEARLKEALATELPLE